MIIAIVEDGYIGLSNEIFLAQHNEVVALGIIHDKIVMQNKKILSMEDVDFESTYSDVSALMDEFNYKSNTKLVDCINSFISCHHKYESNHVWNSTYD